MKNIKTSSIVIILLAMVLIISYQFYKNNFTNNGILNNVINRQGYSLEQINKAVSIEVFIKPEWIAKKPDETKEINVKLMELNNSNIILDNVRNRGNDIYFSFHTTFNMKYKNGQFLYNGVFNEDGSFTSNNLMDGIQIFDKNKQKVKIGQTGFGPNADFSFGIEPKNQEMIQDGFYVKYSGFILYAYSRK